MRIIGGRDYYDSALSYGHDPALAFVRGETLLERDEGARWGLYPSWLHGGLAAAGATPEKPASRATERRVPERVDTAATRVRGTDYTLSFPTVIVAGTRRQGVRGGIHRWDTVGAQPPATYCWTEDQLGQWLAQNGLSFRADEAATRAYFEPSSVPDAVLRAVMERRWTLLVHDPRRTWGDRSWPRAAWHVDQPVLRHVDFARAVPPQLLFQEIEMWLGGVLANAGKPVATVSDAVRAAKHGMDRTSFRRPPSKRR